MSVSILFEFYFENNGVRSGELIVSVDGGCGDGVLNAGEECDDGNLTDGDGCDSTCKEEAEEAKKQLEEAGAEVEVK